METKITKKNKLALTNIIKKYSIAFVLLGMIIVISIVEPKFLSSTNIFNVLTQSAIFGIMALGLTLIIISKGIDLSAGSLVALAGVVAASLGQVADATTKFFPNLGELSLIVPILVSLGIGALLGAVNGSLIAFTGIPAFIATLGMTTIARGLTLMYTKGKPISQLTPGFTTLGGKIGFMPVPVLIYAIMILITWVLLNHTSFGKNVYAIGGNIKAAEVSGINVKKNIVWIYTFAGLMYGVAALVFAGRVGGVHPGAATGYELTAIAATTIGGTSHSGGIGTIGGAVIGALILSVLRNSLTLLGVQAYWQQIIEGVIIVVAVIIDMRKHRRK
ncbi:MAG TPA: ABC transporter permease [Tissierellales bacterium]|nr:ABC transporter permease [Tissierellales bacterium]